jgi:hypothetical protein
MISLHNEQNIEPAERSIQLQEPLSDWEPSDHTPDTYVTPRYVQDVSTSQQEAVRAFNAAECSHSSD